MRCTIDYVYTSHPGKIRSAHQDNLVCLGACLPMENRGTGEPVCGRSSGEGPRLFGVFDGLGGEERGEAAAFLAAEAFRTADLNDGTEAVLAACGEANRRICAFTEAEDLSCCGTTAALLLFDENGVTSCNVGDSRIYRLRGDELVQLSEDHVLPFYGERKAPLLQYLGMPETESLLEPTTGEFPVRKGDLFLLCSDGLTDMLSEERITELIRDTGNPKPDAAPQEPFAGFPRTDPVNDILPPEAEERYREAAEGLLAAALDAGGRDNVTFFLLRVSDVWDTGPEEPVRKSSP